VNKAKRRMVQDRPDYWEDIYPVFINDDDVWDKFWVVRQKSINYRFTTIEQLEKDYKKVIIDNVIE
jgi:hypothetical protein